MSVATAAAQAATRRRRKARGGGPLIVDAEPVIRHLRNLRRAGATLDGIAAASGVHKRHVQRIANSEIPRLNVATQDALLAVRRGQVDTYWVDALGTRRRIQALMWLGWSCAELDRRRGLSKSQTAKLLRASTVSKRVAREIDGLFRELECRQPVAACTADRWAISRTRNYARQQGWVPPSAWDEIDNVRETPKGVAA